MKKIWFGLVLLLSIASCKKYELETVPGNQSPTDGTVTTEIQSTYINKLYISLLGRKPDSIEYNKGLIILKKNNVSIANRTELVNTVMANTGYYPNLFTIARADLLNSVDTADIHFYITVFQNEIKKDPNNPGAPDLQKEIDKLQLLYNVSFANTTGGISQQEMHKRCSYNYVYDQLNMGSANFVVSCFQHFLFRYPTDEEQQAGINMVDGKSAYFFRQTGSSKTDFVNIFFNSADYYEGQVRDLYKRLLFRDPKPDEVVTLAKQYSTNKSYKEIQQWILTTDEYVGIK